MTALPLADASAAVGTIVFVALLAGAFAYRRWLFHGMRARVVTTALPPAQLRLVFEQKVATLGWNVVDAGNPMVAQSTILAGIRQQIALAVDVDDVGRSIATIACVRYSRKLLGGPTKAHTIRLRIDRFVRAVQAQDPSAEIGPPREAAPRVATPLTHPPAPAVVLTDDEDFEVVLRPR